MLAALHIQDFVLIDQLAVSLEEGLTALTGETGAGKSILLEALGLAAGGRVNRAGVRKGAEKGLVSAAFEPHANHPVWGILEENGISSRDDQVILRRVQQADGRTRAFVNDQPVSVGLLRRVGETLVEIHGQHDGHGFLSPGTHRDLLDEFGRCRRDVEAVKGTWHRVTALEGEFNGFTATREKAAREKDYLSHIVHELASLAPEKGEETDLASKRAMLMAAEKVSEDLTAAAALLLEDDFENKLSSAAHRLTRAASSLPDTENSLTSVLGKIDTVLSEIMEAKTAVEEAAEKFIFDTDQLGDVEERLFALRAAARKHGVSPDLLPDFYQKSRRALEEIDGSEARLEDISVELKKAKDEYAFLSSRLSKKRQKAAKALDKAVALELAPLKLGKAEFKTSIQADTKNAGAGGIDIVEFMVATNPGAPAGPLKTIASGGELSRFVLAMKAALAAKENRTVIIFDEVDAGVGGAVADAVGERLTRLAADAQVLVVTHSPQVAARAKYHWNVEKTQTKAQTVTRVAPLDRTKRVEEIARMLSGAEVTDEARAAARQLLGYKEMKTKQSLRKA